MLGHDQESAADLAPSCQRLPHVPPLTILYILFMTAVTAVIFSAPAEQQLDAPHSSLGDATLWVAMNAFSGAAVSGLFLIVWHAARRTLWPLEPGEWLIVSCGALDIVWRCQGVIVSPYGLIHPFDPDNFRILLGLSLAGPFLTAVVYLAVAFAVREHRWWCAVAGLQAAWYLYSGGNQIGLALHLWAYSMLGFLLHLQLAVWLLSLFFLAFTAIRDCRRTRRHWLHWLGVACFGGTMLLSLISLSLIIL